MKLPFWQTRAVVDTRQPLQLQTKTACIQQQCNGLPGHQQHKHFGMLRVEGRLAGLAGSDLAMYR